MVEEYRKLTAAASNEIWKVFRRSLDVHPLSDDSWWQAVLRDFADTGEKYYGTPAQDYVTGYIHVCISELERLAGSL